MSLRYLAKLSQPVQDGNSANDSEKVEHEVEWLCKRSVQVDEVQRLVFCICQGVDLHGADDKVLSNS